MTWEIVKNFREQCILCIVFMKYAKCYIKKYENCQLILVVVLFSRKLVNFLGKKYFFFSLNVLNV